MIKKISVDEADVSGIKGTFLLYSTLGCHLCDQAQELLDSLNRYMSEKYFPDAGAAVDERLFEIRVVDIADDDLLFELYGVRIPVLSNESKTEELAWPFDMEDAYRFIVALI